MLNRLIEELKEVTSTAVAPVLAWSGGRDSTFLLQLMLELGLPFSILTLNHLWTTQQRRFVLRLMKKHELSVFFYAPVAINYTPPYVTLDYFIGQTLIRRVMDHVKSDRCGLDAGRRAMIGSEKQPAYIWDRTIVGTKETDWHPGVHEFKFDDVHGHKFIKPLWGWTDKEVTDTALALNYDLMMDDDPKLDTGNFVACMACVHTDKTVFCPKVQTTIKGVGA